MSNKSTAIGRNIVVEFGIRRLKLQRPIETRGR
uniref:Uncharacterized protein n=1 Tax=Arundo donax TaxID=35708 RepID=A0A0A9AEB1_ARUDO